MLTTTLYFVSDNVGKISTAKRILEKQGLRILPARLSFVERQDQNLQVIAADKAEQAFKELQKPVIVTDAGWYVRAFKGMPGPNAKQFFDCIGIDRLLKALADDEDRYCEMQHVLAFKDHGYETQVFTGTVFGELTHSTRGANMTYLWSDVGKIFVPHGWHKTQAEMSDEEQLQFRESTSDYYAAFIAWLRTQHHAFVHSNGHIA